MNTQIPRSLELLGAGLDDLAATLPGSFPFANNFAGRWGDLFVGWDAQLQLFLKRLVAECAAKRIQLAGGKDLTDLVRSEYGLEPQSGPTKSLGRVVLQRPNANTPPPSGFIRFGHRFQRTGDVTAIPAIPGAAFTASLDRPVAKGELTVEVPLTAVTPGSAANSPLGIYPIAGVTSIDKLFDPTFTIVGHDMAGGSDGPDDPFTRLEALAWAVGRFGPTIGAIYAGALRSTGVRRACVYDAVVNPTNGRRLASTFLVIADTTFASSTNWVAQTQKQVVDPDAGYAGFGESVVTVGSTNQIVRGECTVVLSDPAYLAFTADIAGNIQNAVRELLDGPTTWFTFRYAAIRGAIAKCDSRIRACTSVALYAQPSDTLLTEPAAFPTFPTTATTLAEPVGATHYWLASNGITPTFLPPS